MSNVVLNPGGLIGGLAGAGVGALIIYMRGNTDGRIGRLIGACVIGGAVAGNYVWGRVFPKKAIPPVDEPGSAASQGQA